MERNNYDRSILAIFDILGSFFVDTVYNQLYLVSRSLVREAKASSITDAYKGTIINYMSGISSRKDLYMGVVKNLHEYYQKSNRLCIVFSEFEDKIVSNFIPPEYYRDFTETRKDTVLHDIIIKTVNKFGETVLSYEVLKKIIDNHRNLENVTFLQDKIIDIFIIQRENYYAKFAEKISSKNANNMVSSRLVDKLKKAVVEETKKRCKIENDLEIALKIISQLVEKVNQTESSRNKSPGVTTQNRAGNTYHREQPIVNRAERQIQRNNYAPPIANIAPKYEFEQNNFEQNNFKQCDFEQNNFKQNNAFTASQILNNQTKENKNIIDSISSESSAEESSSESYARKKTQESPFKSNLYDSTDEGESSSLVSQTTQSGDGEDGLESNSMGFFGLDDDPGFGMA